MTMREYEDFLSQCAVCCEHLEMSLFKKGNTLQLPEIGDLFAEKYSEVYYQEEITTIEAVCEIFGVSQNFLTSKIIKYFQEIHHNLENASKLPPNEVSVLEDSTKLALCETCIPLVANIYRVQKVFKSAIAENSLIFNTLGKNFYADEDKSSLQNVSWSESLNIKIEPEHVDDNEIFDGIDDFTENFANNFVNVIKTDPVSDNERIPKNKAAENCSFDDRNSISGKNCKSRRNLKQNLRYSKRLVVSIAKLENLEENKLLGLSLPSEGSTSQQKKTGRGKKSLQILAIDEKNEKLPNELEDSTFDEDYNLPEDLDVSSDDSYKPATTKRSTVKRKRKRNSKPKTVQKIPRENSTNVSHFCVVCEKGFSLKSELDSHMDSYHPQTENSSLPENESAIEKQKKGFEFCALPYFCRSCNSDFESRSGILIHNRLSHENWRRYDCKNCEESFDSTAALVAHLSEIHKEFIRPEKNEDITTCNECGYEVYSRENLRMHKRSTNHMTFSFKCSFCDVKFMDRKELQKHKKSEHREKMLGNQSVIVADRIVKLLNKEKLAMLDKLNNFQCPFCNETFETKQQSVEHKLIHAKEERQIYHCPKCPKTFGKEFYFDRHRLTAHSNQPKVQQCKRCGKTYSNPKYYRKHVNQHVRMEKEGRPICHICGNTFKAKTFLQKHIKVIHQGIGAQQCHQCPYIARTNWDMKCHLQVHLKNGRVKTQKLDIQLPDQ